MYGIPKAVATEIKGEDYGNPTEVIKALMAGESRLYTRCSERINALWVPSGFPYSELLDTFWLSDAPTVIVIEGLQLIVGAHLPKTVEIPTGPFIGYPSDFLKRMPSHCVVMVPNGLANLTDMRFRL